MPRSGAGIYTKAPGTAAVSNDPISSSKHNASVDDFVADANTPRPVVAGGTGTSSASGARTAFGLEIGVDVQAYHKKLKNISELVTATNDMIYHTAPSTYGTFTTTNRFRSFALASNKGEQRTDLDLGSAAVADLLDEDDMASNSNSDAATQQSIRVYVTDKKISWGFKSGELTITTGATMNVVHGLPAAPTRYAFRYRCKTAEHNWSVGDEIHVGSSIDDVGSTIRGPLVFVNNGDTVNFKVMFPGGILIPNKTTFVRSALTDANWKLIVSASM